MKKIPLRNYFILVGLLIVSSIAVLYFTNWYKELQKNSSIMPQYFGELKGSEIDNYIIENTDFIIYMSSKENNKMKNFEKKLKKMLVSKNLLNETIYINIDEFNEKSLKEFVQKYSDKEYTVSLKDAIILIFENQKIKNIFVKNADEINVNDVQEFLIENGV